MDRLKRKATLMMLSAMAVGAAMITILHLLDPKTHLISLVIPPLTVIVCLLLLFYLVKYPLYLQRVIKIILSWTSFILIFPEYFFIIEAFLDPTKRLVDRLPPISSGIFVLITSIIVFLNPREFVKLTILLWLTMAAPIIVYLLCHPQELETPRGLDLMVALVPVMGINLGLLLFYSRLQDTIRQLDRERFDLKEIAERDALTGILNRRAGEQILQRLIERPEQVIGLILCDIDHFKQVNDVHGHLIGDQVLKAVTQCFQSHLRKQDMLVRWGGEEFLIVVVGDDVQELVNLAERLRSKVANQSIAQVGNVTASFGVAAMQPLENLIQLFDRADQALYRAKEAGRNQVTFA